MAKRNINLTELVEEREILKDEQFRKINEIEGDSFEFSRRPKKEKRLFIARGGYLTKAKSWDHLDVDLKKMYINSITENNLKNKFTASAILYNYFKNCLNIDDFNSNLCYLNRATLL